MKIDEWDAMDSRPLYEMAKAATVEPPHVEAPILINADEVSWPCWEYVCLRCGVDPGKVHRLLLYVSRFAIGNAPSTFCPEEVASGENL